MGAHHVPEIDGLALPLVEAGEILGTTRPSSRVSQAAGTDMAWNRPDASALT